MPRSALAALLLAPLAASSAPLVPPDLLPALVCASDFEHPAPDDATGELDQGPSGTTLRLVNGGAAMRVADGPGDGHALQTRQIAPDSAGNDDWKAGVFARDGVPTLAAFAGAPGVTLSGWVKPDGPALRPPSPPPRRRPTTATSASVSSACSTAARTATPCAP